MVPCSPTTTSVSTSTSWTNIPSGNGVSTVKADEAELLAPSWCPCAGASNCGEPDIGVCSADVVPWLWTREGTDGAGRASGGANRESADVGVPTREGVRDRGVVGVDILLAFRKRQRLV